MADTSNRIAGIATITVDGQNYRLRGNFKYSACKVKRETIAGQDGIHGYSEMPVAGFIEADLSDMGGLKVVSLNGMTNVTVVAELANGKQVIGRNMWQVGDPIEATAEDGKLTGVRWESYNVLEV